MSIARRSDGRWVVKFKNETSGAWQQRTFRTEDQARQFQAEMEYDAVENNRLTVAEAVLVFLRNTRHSPITTWQYLFVINGHDNRDGSHTEGPAEFLADKFVDSLTRRDLENMREACRQRGNRPHTINKKISRLTTAFDWCVEQELLGVNPWKRYRNIPEGRPRHHSGTLDQLQVIYPALPPWMQWAATTALALCLRPGLQELFSLKWTAFNWDRRTVTVFMPKVDRSKTVYPPETYMDAAWLRYQEDARQGRELVCRGPHDRPVRSTATYSSAWRRACLKVGVRIAPYALRHIAASEMLANGADLAAVAAQLGHSDLTTTGHYYAHALPRAQRQAAAALPCTKLVQDGAGSGGKNQ